MSDHKNGIHHDNVCVKINDHDGDFINLAWRTDDGMNLMQ